MIHPPLQIKCLPAARWAPPAAAQPQLLTGLSGKNNAYQSRGKKKNMLFLLECEKRLMDNQPVNLIIHSCIDLDRDERDKELHQVMQSAGTFYRYKNFNNFF